MQSRRSAGLPLIDVFAIIYLIAGKLGFIARECDVTLASGDQQLRLCFINTALQRGARSAPQANRFSGS
jgi:hypothetical protein